MSSSDPCLVVSCYGNNGHFGYGNGNYGHYVYHKDKLPPLSIFGYTLSAIFGLIAVLCLGGLIFGDLILKCYMAIASLKRRRNRTTQQRTGLTVGAVTVPLPTLPNLARLREVLVEPGPNSRLALVRFNQPEMVSGQVWGMPREFGIPGEPPATYQKAEAALRSSLAVLSPKAQL